MKTKILDKENYLVEKIQFQILRDLLNFHPSRILEQDKNKKLAQCIIDAVEFHQLYCFSQSKRIQNFNKQIDKGKQSTKFQLLRNLCLCKEQLPLTQNEAQQKYFLEQQFFRFEDSEISLFQQTELHSRVYFLQDLLSEGSEKHLKIVNDEIQQETEGFTSE
ncbi:unnamed protein product (macronuclear) [Paramecium tetraurelia]|uniref:Uncharacterized protein n=1 Tax=Paramecium tetraurelia TaxID=5888 RepID=A0E8N0_PARTE|nr:uncharacterized protein GSPATT00024376001 [Paramecium tetraurelia]CAK91647.1 unnamed protein product [Paramecium tetraurelia]|eukprot:XP_001459044.1 hypothetical protein (macronuclear) [Paramecium tetraurelia strain d4-2]